MAQYDPAEDGADYPLYDSDDPGDLYANDGDWPDPPQRWRHTRWAVYGGAFALPLVLLIALLALLARLDGPDEESPSNPGASATSLATPDAAETASGDWPPDVTFAAHTTPALIKNELALAGARHGYRFAGATDEVWEVAAEPLPGSAIVPLLTLYAPSGEALASGTALIVVLPQDGEYRLVAEAGQGGSATGAYQLSVFPR
ncbi:MAG: hypothetical protein M5U29_15820 [Anaerolineae bacterium]|nr:hypothetical protein [Anaerolineae bacterium]